MKFTITILAIIGCVAADVSHLSGSYLPPVQPQAQYLPPAPEPQYLPPAQPQPQYLPPAPEPQYLPPVQPQQQYLPPVVPEPEYLPPAPVDTPVYQDGYRYKTVRKYRLRSH